LTRQNTFEVDVGMAPLLAAFFSIDLSSSGTIDDDYFFFLRRPLCLPEM
jgi:hypothetical protein